MDDPTATLAMAQKARKQIVRDLASRPVLGRAWERIKASIGGRLVIADDIYPMWDRIIQAALLEAQAEALESVSLQGCTFPHDAIGVIHRSARSLRAAAAELRDEVGDG